MTCATLYNIWGVTISDAYLCRYVGPKRFFTLFQNSVRCANKMIQVTANRPNWIQWRSDLFLFLSFIVLIDSYYRDHDTQPQLVPEAPRLSAEHPCIYSTLKARYLNISQDALCSLHSVLFSTQLLHPLLHSLVSSVHIPYDSETTQTFQLYQYGLGKRPPHPSPSISLFV